MMKRIPNLNNIFEYEKKYLEEKHHEGFKLKKRGLLFYHFTPVVPSKATYEMDLSCKQRSGFQLQTDDWVLLTERHLLFRQLKKGYYYNQNPEAQLLVDEQLRLEYYKYKRAMWWIVLVLFPFFAIFGAALAYASESVLFESLFTVFIFLIPYPLYKAIPFIRGIRFLDEKLANKI